MILEKFLSSWRKFIIEWIINKQLMEFEPNKVIFEFQYDKYTIQILKPEVKEQHFLNTYSAFATLYSPKLQFLCRPKGYSKSEL